MGITYYCKTQIVCLLVLVYVGCLLIKDGCKLNSRAGKELCSKTYDALFIVSEICILFDGITAYTVNYLEQVPLIVNHILHAIYLSLIETFICVHFFYWKGVTEIDSRRKRNRLIWSVPAILCVAVTVCSMPWVTYIEGKYSNYSWGIPVYSCFICVVIYCILTIAIFLRKSVYIEKNKKTGFTLAMMTLLVIAGIQFLDGETLFAAPAIMLTVLSIYLLMENPTVKEAKEYHNDMIMGFATLIENKDNNTGGHIRRTSMYAVLIAEELRHDKRYSNIITKDFMENLKMAAPMHDIGKIGIPDVVLRKPGKLTDEEYEIMKTHSQIGGKIISESFGHMMDDEYREMAYQVAYHHHEKWNGKGYPDGLSGTDIPFSARIMAVADVFDAVSAKRCYRDALPLEVCFNIIKNGRGTDFDPDIVDAFFRCRDRIENVALTRNADQMKGAGNIKVS